MDGPVRSSGRFRPYFLRFLRSDVFLVTRVAALLEEALALGFFGETFFVAILFTPLRFPANVRS